MAKQPKSKAVRISSIELHSLNKTNLNNHQPIPGALPLTIAAIAARRGGTNSAVQMLCTIYNKAHFLLATMNLDNRQITGVVLDLIEGRRTKDSQHIRVYMLVKVVLQRSGNPEIGYVIVYTNDSIYWRGLPVQYALPAGLVYDPTFDDFAFLGLT